MTNSDETAAGKVDADNVAGEDAARDPGQKPRRDEAAKPRGGIVGQSLAAIWEFMKAVVAAPLVLVRGRRHTDSIMVYSAHPSFFLWLLILAGFLGAWLVNHKWVDPETAGWVYIWIMLYSLVTLMYDFGTRKLVLWAGIFALLWLLAKYVEHIKHIAVVGYLVGYLADLSPKLDPGTVTVLSWLLLFPWIGSLFQMVLYGRKRFTPNEIGEFHFGEGHELTDRTGLRFRTRYRDVLETILTFGGGDLLAVDNHQNVIKRWDNVIGLFFAWKDLDHILHQRSVTDDDDDHEKS